MQKENELIQIICHNQTSENFTAVTQKLATTSTSSSVMIEETSTSFDDIIGGLKEKFKNSQVRSEKVMILTIFGLTWTVRKIMSEFDCSQRMSLQAVKLAKASGILTTPNSKNGRPIIQETKELVIKFYNDDEVSRLMPGKKDCISLKVDGTKVHIQKRLLLSNLKEAYQLFVERHPDKKIGFSTFADMRPRECIIAGASGTHSVCVCTIHQNVKLMMVGSKMEDVTMVDGSEISLKHYSQALLAIIWRNERSRKLRFVNFWISFRGTFHRECMAFLQT